MPAPSLSDSEPSRESEDAAKPTISACERSPGAVVFLEAGNTDGWIATDLVVESRE
jgi:hypothetical protein